MVFNCLIYFFPIELMALLITLRLFRIKIAWQNLFWPPLLHSLSYYFIHFGFIPSSLKVLISVKTAVLLMVLFLKQDYITSILLTFTCYFILVPLELSWVGLRVELSEETYFEIFSSFSKTAYFGLTIFFILLILYLVIRYKDFSLMKEGLNQLLRNQGRSKYLLITVFLCGQSIVIIDMVYLFLSRHKIPFREIYFLTIIITLLVLVSVVIKNIFILIQDEVQLAIAQEQIKSLSKLNFTLKSQKHDFGNHLQLIMSLVQMGKTDQVVKYIKEITGEINQVKPEYRSGIVPLDGLLQYKVSLARKYNIDLQIHISGSLSNLPMNNLELCRVVGNLLNNAIEYLQEKEGIERKIEFSIQERVDSFWICVTNPVEAEEVFQGGINRLLQPGFTSKGEGHGLGLAIVNEIVNKVGGDLYPDWDQNRSVLTFQIDLPRSNIKIG